VSSDETPRAPTQPAEQASASPGLHEQGLHDLPETLDGRYVVDREIAHGGMGRIYAGRDLRLSREVAVKILRQLDGATIARFEQEIRLAARLQHPGIVTVYDAGFRASGEPFLVMKLVLGRSFDRAIADADSLTDRLALLPHLATVADALAYAHDQGVVHRDLKPQNVILGAFGETVVLDWGLAKSLAIQASQDPDPVPALPAPVVPEGLTLDGAVVGTPAYMSPEQAEGRAVDVRTDVYALGAILYQMLTGQPPAPSSAGVKSVVPLARLEPNLPADLLAIVHKAMAWEPADRYPSAFELSEDLKRFLAGQWVAARRYSLPAHLWRWLSKRPAFLLALGAILAALVAWRRC
jgi:serine/threonine protein kinase